MERTGKVVVGSATAWSLVIAVALHALTNVAMAKDAATHASVAKPSSKVALQVKASPEVVLRAYLRAMYARDAVTAYALTSTADRATKTPAEHARESMALGGVALRLARELAAHISFENVVVEEHGKTATVTFDAMLPDANDAPIQMLAEGFDRKKLSSLTPEQVDRRVAEFKRLAKRGELKLLRSSGEVWQLVLENERWSVIQHWADAIEVTFEARTFLELGWEFTPVQERVFAKHGETIQMAYRAKNISAHESTGKARHIIGPEANAEHLQIIACFCFLEQTLAPGEEVDLPLVFRVGYGAPDGVNDFTVRYEFYPIDKFPPLAHTSGPNG